MKDKKIVSISSITARLICDISPNSAKYKIIVNEGEYYECPKMFKACDYGSNIYKRNFNTPYSIMLNNINDNVTGLFITYTKHVISTPENIEQAKNELKKIIQDRVSAMATIIQNTGIDGDIVYEEKYRHNND